MRISLVLRGAVVPLLLVSATGCFSLRGPTDVHEALDRNLGVHLHQEFGFNSGFLLTKLGGGILRVASDEPVSLEGLKGVELGIYSVPEGKASVHGHISQLALEGWNVILRARDKEGEALFLTRQDGDSIREVLLIVQDADEGEIVVARLKGRLEQLLERTVHDACEGHGRAAVARDVAVVRHED